MREITRLIAHCADTPPGWMADAPLADQVAEIRRWHVAERGFSDIGYHEVIGRGGDWLPGRPLERIGAHCQGLNSGSIGVCLIGGHGASAVDRFREHFTEAQAMTLLARLEHYARLYPEIRISGHNQHAARACPGFNVPDWLGPEWRRHTMRPAPHRERTLRRGDRGEDVLILQRLLGAQNVGRVTQDGIFGPQTERALRRYQRLAGIADDGIAGPRTFRALGYGTT